MVMGIDWMASMKCNLTSDLAPILEVGDTVSMHIVVRFRWWNPKTWTRKRKLVTYRITAKITADTVQLEANDA